MVIPDAISIVIQDAHNCGYTSVAQSIMIYSLKSAQGSAHEAKIWSSFPVMRRDLHFLRLIYQGQDNLDIMLKLFC